MLECTFKYETEFAGFGKHRQLVKWNEESQKKQKGNGEKVGIRLCLTKHGLKTHHLWKIMAVLAAETKALMRKNPTPAKILEVRAREIGEGYRNSDDFIKQLD